MLPSVVPARFWDKVLWTDGTLYQSEEEKVTEKGRNRDRDARPPHHVSNVVEAALLARACVAASGVGPLVFPIFIPVIGIILIFIITLACLFNPEPLKMRDDV